MELRRSLIVLALLSLSIDAAASWEITQAGFDLSKSSRRSHANALYDSGSNKTFLTWSGPNMHPRLRVYNHNNQRWSGVTKLQGIGVPDHHNNPSIVKTADGRLLIFYADHNRDLYMFRSGTSLNISSWTHSRISTANATYPLPFVTDDGSVYVFYRGSFSSRNKPLRYIKSTDGGASWRSAKSLVYFNRSDEMNTIYVTDIFVEKSQGKKERVHFSWILAGPNSDGTGYYDSTHRNLYYAIFDTANDKLYSVSGANLGSVIDDPEASIHNLVLNTGIPSGHDIAYTSTPIAMENGRHVLMFKHSSDGHSLKRAKWNGSRWTIKTIVSGISSLQDLRARLGNDISILVKQGGEVEEYLSQDSGWNWSKVSTISHRQDLVRAAYVENGIPELEVLLSTLGDDGWSEADFSGRYPVYVAGTAPIERLILEAEDGALSGDFGISEILGASGEESVSAVGSNKYSMSQNSSYSEFEFYVTTPGHYEFRAWASGPNAQSNSFFFKLDGHAAFAWHVQSQSLNEWEWVLKGANPYSRFLSPGFHRVRIFKRESGADLDKLQLVLK